MSRKIDEIDLKILKLLSENARYTYKELAEKLGTTRQRVSRRMDKLEKGGVVIKYTVIPDLNKLNYVHVILGLILRPTVDLDEVVKQLKSIEYVKIVEKTLGSHSLIVHLVGPNNMAFTEKMIRSIAKEIQGIDKMDITFVTEICKFEVI